MHVRNIGDEISHLLAAFKLDGEHTYRKGAKEIVATIGERFSLACQFIFLSNQLHQRVSQVLLSKEELLTSLRIGNYLVKLVKILIIMNENTLSKEVREVC